MHRYGSKRPPSRLELVYNLPSGHGRDEVMVQRDIVCTSPRSAFFKLTGIDPEEWGQKIGPFIHAHDPKKALSQLHSVGYRMVHGK